MNLDTSSANRFVLDPSNLANLRSSLKTPSPAGLHQAAQQFEALMLQMVLKSMRDATPQTGMMDNDQTRFFTSVLDQQLAQNLSSQGKLGFAKMIEQQLGRSTASSSATEEGRTDKAAETFQQNLLDQRQAATSAAWGMAAAGAARWRSVTDSPGRSASPIAAEGSGAKDFVDRILPYAAAAANRLGVPVQFVVAHSALESGWGKSEIRSADGRPTFNLFGVKAGKGWQGPTAEVATTEYIDGVAYAVKEKFRVYSSYAESFRDYANMLSSNSRFSSVLGQQDGSRFSTSLQRSGYATDPQYADKLYRIINGSTLRQAFWG